MNDELLLRQNAWLLMDWRNVIRTHEDWCKIPVIIKNGIVPGALKIPTIGTYLEFWEGDGCVENSQTNDERVIVGTLGLVIKFVGNPGTGSNSCCVSWGNGIVTHECIWPFPPIYRGFHQASKNNPLPEEPAEHDLAWLIEQVKSLKSK